MAEWSNAPVLKTGVLRGTGGSNPSLSAQSPVNLAIYRTFLFYIILSMVLDNSLIKKSALWLKGKISGIKYRYHKITFWLRREKQKLAVFFI